MVPYGKLKKNIHVNPSNISVHQMQESQRRVLIDNPLQEFEVFSDTEDEFEYLRIHRPQQLRNLTNSRSEENIILSGLDVDKRNGKHANSSFNFAKEHTLLKCDLEKDIHLKDVLKFLSTYKLEAATKSELNELISQLNWLSFKYNDIVKIPHGSLCSSCKRKTNVDTGNNPKKMTFFQLNLKNSRKNEGIDKKKKCEEHKTNQIEIKPLSQKKRTGLGKSKKAKKTQSYNQSKKTVSNTLFKHSLANNTSLERNEKYRSHSLYFDNSVKQKPHFMSFQNDLKRRTLYSPSKWLNSEEFTQHCEI